MTAHDEYIRKRSERSPGFAEDLADARAELQFADALAERREQLGLSQAEVAARAGMQQAAIARYEKAGRTPTLLTLWRLADALRCEIVLGPGRRVRLAREETTAPPNGHIPKPAKTAG